MRRGVVDNEQGAGPRLTEGRWFLALATGLAAALAVGGYLAASHWLYRIGFPLDDAWIHQTYARSLGLYGEWAYLPGQRSAGSTAPLWTALLAAGYLLRLAPLAWATLLGWLLLWGCGLLGAQVFLHLVPQRREWALAAGLLLVLEWHLVWAAASGMETTLYALWVLAAIGMMLASRPHWMGLGVWIGAAAWVRPDAVTLLGPALLAAWANGQDGKERLRAGLRLGLGALMLLLPYLAFNLWAGGEVWPGTFFAKQAEYAEMRQLPLLQRLAALGVLPLVGVGCLLLPGFLYCVARSAQERRWTVLGLAVWLAGFMALYALRLPVTYQHGRYLIPAMPVYFLLGLAGMAAWYDPSAQRLWRRVAQKAWALAAACVLLWFLALGGRAYALDTALIESEMVDTARWVAANTPPGSRVAAHDIGALGYFGQRPLIDLAGLITPEVIPFIRDEQRLGQFLDEQQADYLVTFPAWYPRLVEGRVVEYSGDQPYSMQLGGEHMRVYRWQR